ncbi:MAG: ParA family protein [Limnochordia bacterium]|jgi:chromosome partitioning protein|nr:AAA family ATPase [Limnochordia bacterium]MDD2628966.1 ParA family protein [Limnochordia bacterium]MDD4517455.1 ParA family protein [Limnochordia bacterium]
MSRIIAVANQKGGVGKTTSTLNLGAALAEMGKRVLFVDLDPQGGLTVSCGYEPDTLPKTIYNAMMRGLDAKEIMLTTEFGPDLLPANIDLSLAEMDLIGTVSRERRLGIVLREVRDNYDFILIDCQPTLGLLTLNALAVADEMLIPVACEFLALRGVKALLKMYGKVRLQLNSKLKIVGILPTMYDERTRHSKSVLEEINTTFDGKIPVFDVVIKRSIRFAEAAQAGQPIMIYAKRVEGASAYRKLAEILTA